ncbi:unnamed protein product [Malus baccata var. baccata]
MRRIRITFSSIACMQNRSFTRAMNMVNDYFKDNSGHAEKTEEVAEDNLIKRQGPMSLYVKIIFDGSVSNSLAAGGFVVINWESKPILTGAMNMGFDTVRGACDAPWNLRSIIENLRWCATYFHDIKWRHIFREANFVADAMTSIRLNIKELCIWDACLLVEANMAFLFYCNGTGCVRGFSL